MVGRRPASASRSARVVGGAIAEGISWHWIFWVNVPIGLALVPFSLRVLRESHRAERAPRPARRSRSPAAACMALVLGIVRANELGWTSATTLGLISAGLVLLVAFLLWERRAPEPMLPLRFFKSRAFSATNAVSFAMFFGVFGSIFFLSQFFQTVQGYSPLESGLLTLPWTAMPMFVAPVAGPAPDRIGSRPLMALGLALQAVARRAGWRSSPRSTSRTRRSCRRSCWAAPAWGSSSPRPPTPC